MNRIQHAEQLAGLVPITQRHERQHCPDGRVGVLAAVFTNTRDIAFDIAGVPLASGRTVASRGESARLAGSQDAVPPPPWHVRHGPGLRPR